VKFEQNGSKLDRVSVGGINSFHLSGFLFYKQNHQQAMSGVA